MVYDLTQHHPDSLAYSPEHLMLLLLPQLHHQAKSGVERYTTTREDIKVLKNTLGATKKPKSGERV